jgi:hypothetical protein
MPSGLVIFGYRKNETTVTEAGVPAVETGMAFRLYAESSGNMAAAERGAVETGVAIANAAASEAVVNFELTNLAGVSTGLSGTMRVPANGHASRFLYQIEGFGSLPKPFRGVLRISTAASPGIAVVGLRGRYNERDDFLITTTHPQSESSPPSTAERFFPHLADGGGYTTHVILFNGLTDQASSGLLRFFNQSGQPLSPSLR